MCAVYTFYEAFVFINNSKMMVARQKCKHVHKTLQEKTQGLKDIGKGLSNKEAAAKYNVPKSTISNKKYHIYIGQK